VPDDPVPDDAAGLRAANARLRAVVEAKAAQIEVLRAELDAERELRRRQELRVAELERRLGMDSTDSGTPSSKERVGAREARRARQQSERERRKDRKRGGQPGHQGKGLGRHPDPGERKDAAPPAECRSCRASLDGAVAAGSPWAQVIDAKIAREVTGWLLPGLACPCCGTVTFAAPPPGAHAGAVSYGPVLNAAAVLLTCYGNVPPERAAQVIGMLPGIGVSAGWVDKAAARVNAQLGKGGFDDAMIAALAGEDVLAADETPVSILDKTAPCPLQAGAQSPGGAARPTSLPISGYLAASCTGRPSLRNPASADAPEQPVLDVRNRPGSRRRRPTERPLRARLHHEPLSHQVIALAAAGQLGMAAAGKIRLTVVIAGQGPHGIGEVRRGVALTSSNEE
jgi:hypothetical protein